MYIELYQYNPETRTFAKPMTAEEYDAKIAKLQGKVANAREGMKISRGEYAKRYAKRGAAIGAAAGGIGGSLLAGNVVGAGVRAAGVGVRAVTNAVGTGASAIGHGIGTAGSSMGDILSSGKEHLIHGVHDVSRSYSNPFKAVSNISTQDAVYLKPGLTKSIKHLHPSSSHVEADGVHHMVGGHLVSTQGNREYMLQHASDNASPNLIPTPMQAHGILPHPSVVGHQPAAPEVPHEVTTGGIVGGGIIGTGIGAAAGAGIGAVAGYTKHRRLGRSIERNMKKIAKLERDKQKLAQ